ncbi:hypothetical protein C4580_04420 [Candidatus Woesearchaeota archaeon]|nr:MAG: hypothetical protein C4580_04420 [Candidatus Woesearchaeota archaeon]
MKAIQAVKKMVALGMGLTMVGATIFGASAAKLSDYPAPFVVNGTPASNLAIIVGDQADGSDVVGAVDIIQSLQSQAVVKVASAGQPSQLVVEGDAVEIGSTSDLLEIGEPIGDVRETLTEVDLDMLKGGQIVTDQGSTEFNQYLRFPNNATSGVVLFAEDERDRVGHYLFWDDGNVIFEWELEFEEGLESEVENDDLVDLEDEDVTVLGQPFVIVDTDLRVNNQVLSNLGANGNSLTGTNATPDLVIEFIGGAVSAVLGENDKETYVVDGKEYEVEVLVISETSNAGEGSVKFRINGEITDELEDGETDVLADGTQIGIRDILATGKDIQKSIVQFYLGAYKVEFRDTNTSDALAVPAGAEVNEETIEDSFVTIRGQFVTNPPAAGSLTGSEFEVQNIRYNLTADAVLGDMYIPPGTGVRAQLDEPEGMLTPNWDIRYEGLMDTGVTLLRVDAAGDDEYDLEFTNQEGIFFDVPLASNEAGNAVSALGLTGFAPAAPHQFKYGDDDDDLWFTEYLGTGDAGGVFATAAGLPLDAFYITDDDFFVLSNCVLPVGTLTDNTCFSHVLRFDSADTTNRQLTFTDLGTGTREVTYDAVTFLANLVVGGVTYTVGVSNAAGVVTAPLNLTIDLNGDGMRTNNTKVLIGIQGEGLLDLGTQAWPTLTTASLPDFGLNGVATGAIGGTSFNLSLITLAKEFDEAAANENISINVTARTSSRVGLQSVGNGTPAGGAGQLYGLFSLEENDDLSQALSGYGVFLELFDPEGSDDAEDLTVEYPLSQRGARVFVTGGVVSTRAIEAGGVERVQPIQIGAAKLASEVSDVSMYNAIVVGGPCANPIAAALLGNPEPCYESVSENKALVKLVEHTNGNVALLVNGRTAMNTRQGARAVATGMISKVTGMEAEVTGATLTDVTVAAV